MIGFVASMAVIFLGGYAAEKGIQWLAAPLVGNVVEKIIDSMLGAGNISKRIATFYAAKHAGNIAFNLVFNNAGLIVTFMYGTYSLAKYGLTKAEANKIFARSSNKLTDGPKELEKVLDVAVEKQKQKALIHLIKKEGVESSKLVVEKNDNDNESKDDYNNQDFNGLFDIYKKGYMSEDSESDSDEEDFDLSKKMRRKSFNQDDFNEFIKLLGSNNKGKLNLK